MAQGRQPGAAYYQFAKARKARKRSLPFFRTDRRRPKPGGVARSFAKVVAMDAASRPRLRSVETVVARDPEHDKVLVLRDTRGVSPGHAVLPPALVPLVARFTGSLRCDEIAREVSIEVGSDIPVDVVVRLAVELERALFLEGPVFRAALAGAERQFAEAPIRAAAHAGGAYYAERVPLAKYVEDCRLRATQKAQPGSRLPLQNGGGRMVALVSPHIDPWRGALCYGYAYSALAAALPPQADTFVVFGTSHAPMREPFALCRKAFDTPLGLVEADLAAIDEVANKTQGFDPYADQFNHKIEHSLEFQVVFLKNVMAGRPFRIVPILAGLGAHQSTGLDPAEEPSVATFIGAVRDFVQSRDGRVVVVSGADMAHVGPRFGDAKPYDPPAREAHERKDRESLDHAIALDASGFWSQVAADLDDRRVCGLAPTWSLLSVISAIRPRGRVLHYEQTVDGGDGSIVSHAAVGYYA
jgi:AmmeMemoRadiSam system protein B